MRPKEFDVDDALEHALITFWTKGYQSTSMQDLLDSMKLGRASMYHTFGSKEKLFSRVIDLYTQSRCRKWIEALESGHNTQHGIENLINAIIKHATAKGNPGGCLVALCSAEEVQFSEDVTIKLKSAYHALMNAIVNHLQQGVDNGELQKEVNPKTLATYIVNVLLGIMSLSKVLGRTANYKAILKYTMTTIATLSTIN